MPRILIVDDDAVIRELLAYVLKQEGYEVIEATNGAEGLQKYQAEPTDLVITDLMMPGMDGLELLKELRRVVPTPALIAISGDQAALMQARAFTSHTFAKPLSIEQVLAAVQALVSARP